MKRGIVYLLTLLFLAVAAVCFWRSGAWDGSVALTAKIDGQAEVRSWDGGQGTHYLFLPGFAGPEDIRLQTDASCRVFLHGRQITGEAVWDDLPMDTDLDLVYVNRGKEHHYTLRLVSSRNVAALFLETASGSLSHIHEEKGNREPASMELYTADGKLSHAGNLELQGRGNDSWGKEKKPYSLELSSDADLLGMGAAKKWVLLANYSDPTHLRNKAVYEFAKTIGLSYSPDCQWTEVYINGEYLGLYLLSERNEVHPERVDIPEEEHFLVSMEPLGRLEMQNYPHVPTDSGIAFRIRETSLSQDSVAEVLRQADRAIHAENGIDPVTGSHWQQLLDLDSWAKKYLIEEVFANLDANAASQFAYFSAGRLYAGPVWDYDLSMGSHKIWQTAATDALFAGAAHIWSQEDHPWFAALMQQPAFRDRVVELYETEFRPRVQALLSGGMEAYAREIRLCAERNRLRWSCEDYAEHVSLAEAYLTRRLAFLDSLWLAGEPYHFVNVNIRTGANIGCYAVRPGEVLTQFPEERAIDGKTHQGWYRVDTDEPFDLTRPIYEDADVYLKWTPTEAAAPQPEEEPLSLLRLAPAVVFAVMLAIVTSLGLRRSSQKKKEEVRL